MRPVTEENMKFVDVARTVHIAGAVVVVDDESAYRVQGLVCHRTYMSFTIKESTLALIHIRKGILPERE